MFDKYYKQDDSFITVTKHEHRAPTDKSVELLREMERKALEQVIARVDVANNVFDGKILVMRDPMRDRFEVVLRYRVNGKDYTDRFDFDRRDLDALTEQKAVEMLYQAASKKIAESLLTAALPDLGAFTRR